MSELFHAASALGALAFAGLALLSGSLRPHGWLLSLHVAPLALVSTGFALTATLDEWTTADAARAAIALVIAASPYAFLFTRRITGRPRSSRRRWTEFVALAVPTLALAGTIAATSSTLDASTVDFGSAGSVAGLALMLLSVLTLAGLERALRATEEHVLWEIKFLVLGLGLEQATTIYVSSKMLLLPELDAGVAGSLSFALLPAAATMLISLRRLSRPLRISVSEGLTYGSITFFFVGIYLITSSALTRWASVLIGSSIENDTILFLISGVFLSAILLSRTVRQNTRQWIRRNLFSGKYDYRAYWLECLQSLQVRGDLRDVADALVSMVERAVAATDVSVWIRDRGRDVLTVAAARGPNIRAERATEVSADLLSVLDDRREPARVEFVEQTGAGLLLPLDSGGERIGILAVGSDDITEYPWEVREFLTALATHAAGEFRRAELEHDRSVARESEAFRSFATFVLHDLKNFATTLSMIAKNASRHASNPEFLSDAFESVLDTSEKMKVLCNSLRVFSARAPTRLDPVDFDSLVRTACEEAEPSLQTRIQLELSGVGLVEADAQEISRLLRNLLLNADQASAPGSVVAVATSTQDDDTIQIEVRDHGIGIPADFRRSGLFEPFRTTKSDGLGIGLFHCRQIAEGHRGRIEVDSEEDVGTTVRVTLPRTH